jgi:peroxiredoxin
VAIALAGCSPRNGLPIAASPGGDDDDSAGNGSCGAAGNGWPEVLPEHQDYEGEGADSGERLPQFELRDQSGNATCFSQFLGYVLIVDASTRWCGPCNEAAGESMELWPQMRQIAPSWFLTLMVQDFNGLPATQADVEYWAEHYELSYPVVLDENEATRQDWGVLSFPLFLFIAPDGTVVQRVEQKPSADSVLAFVEQQAEEWGEAIRPYPEDFQP